MWTEKKPLAQVPGSAIVVDKNYKEPGPISKGPTPFPPVKQSGNPAPKIAATVAAEPEPFNPATFKDQLIKVAKAKGLGKTSDLSSFLGQCEVETAKWTKAAENFKYSDPVRIYKVFTSNFPTPKHAEPYIGNQVALANRALAGKNGNGDESSGDGWKYRGRGFIHITGRELYSQAGAGVHPENPSIYINNPELLSSNPKEAALASVWYFKKKVGLGKTTKQASQTVNPAGLKGKERNQAAQAIKQQLTKKTVK